MANNQLTVGELVYKISGDMDNLKTELKKAETEIGNLKNSIEKTDKSTSTFGDTMKKLATGLGLVYLSKLALDFGKASVQAFANAQNSLMQYNNAEENVAGTRKEQINLLNDYILDLEKKTTVDDKSIRQGAQILAQDQIKIENQKKLLAGIVDIAVANSRANGGEVDVAGTARAVGRVISTGDTGILTRQNIVVDPKTAKAIKDTGDEAQRTALVMKILEENGKGAGEALGQSFQGKINRAKDTLEDLQVAIGKGLTSAFGVFASGLGDTVGGLKDTTDGTNALGVAFVYIAGLANFVINSIKLLGLGLMSYGNILFNEAKITFAFGQDVIGVFKKVGVAIMAIGTSMKDVLSGNFKGAVEDLKNGFDFSGTFDNTAKAFDGLLDSNQKLADSMLDTTKNLGDNITTMANAKEVYKQATADQDKLTQAKDATNKALQKEAELSDDAKKEIETLRDKVLDLKNKSDELANSLGEKLVEATNKFKDSIKGIVEDSAKSMADIVVKAETDIADLRKQLAEEQSKSGDQQSADSIKKLQDEITQKQRILTSQAQFQTDLNAKIADIQKKADEAQKAGTTEVDPAKKAILDATTNGLTLQIEALKGFADLDKQIADARKLAGEDEFKQAEITTFAKLDLATKLYIEETSKLMQKQAIAFDVEKSITNFYVTQTNLRQKTLDAFATTTIATLRQIGSEAQSAMSALNSARSAGAQINSPIIPTTIPTSTSGTATSSSQTTTNSKTVNAPITVNATIKDSTDPATVARDLAWQLSHL